MGETDGNSSYVNGLHVNDFGRNDLAGTRNAEARNAAGRTADRRAPEVGPSSARGRTADRRVPEVGPPARRDELWIEALMDRLYRADGLNIVDFTMSVVMTHATTIEGVIAGVRHFKDPRITDGTDKQAMEAFAKALAEYYAHKGSGGGPATRIIDHWEEEQRAREEEKAKATDVDTKEQKEENGDA